MEHVALPVEPWSNFYVIVGSSAGGLTGLTFVVIALVAEVQVSVKTGLRAFVTPTIVHFGSALTLSALLNVPGQTLFSIALCLGVMGLWGVAYTAGTAHRIRHLGASYTAVAEDWIWNVLLPLVCYGGLMLAAWLIGARVAMALDITGAIALLLLFIGIHNAWDIAVWFTAERPGARGAGSDASPPADAAAAPAAEAKPPAK